MGASLRRRPGLLSSTPDEIAAVLQADQRIDSFLTDVLALAGEDPDAIRKGVRVALADCEAIFRAQEMNTRMRDRAAHACRALCRARVVEEIQDARERGSQTISDRR
jgi:hypothetical protein